MMFGLMFEFKLKKEFISYFNYVCVIVKINKFIINFIRIHFILYETHITLIILFYLSCYTIKTAFQLNFMHFSLYISNKRIHCVDELK